MLKTNCDRKSHQHNLTRGEGKGTRNAKRHDYDVCIGSIFDVQITMYDYRLNTNVPDNRTCSLLAASLDSPMK